MCPEICGLVSAPSPPVLALIYNATASACMHVLRSSYLPLYAHRIIPPYTTDPFPATDTAPGSLRPSHRETEILDLYILIKVRQDMRAVESELYLDSEDEQYRDMFNLMQVRLLHTLCSTYLTLYHSLVRA